jgi:hypothetical protein
MILGAMQGTSETMHPAEAMTPSKKYSVNIHQAQTTPMNAGILDDQHVQFTRLCAALLPSADMILTTMPHTLAPVLVAQDTRRNVRKSEIYQGPLF